MPPVDVRATVISNVRLSRDYNVLTLAAPEVGAITEPGQFVMLKTSDALDPMLRRPFSVFEVLRDDIGTVRAISVLNKRAGRTTGLLYDLEAGATVSCLGPLGLPFNPPASGAAWLVAGGVGLAPFATLAEALLALEVPTTLFYGARTGEELYYLEFFDRLGVQLVLCTEDGSIGIRGPGHRAARRRAAGARRARRGDALCVRARAHAGRRRQALGPATGSRARSRWNARWAAAWAAVTAASCR